MLINKLTGKAKSTLITTEFLLNGVKETNSKIISNAFAKHYSEIGELYAKRVKDSMTDQEKNTVLKESYCYRNRERLRCNGILIISKA